MIYALFRSVPMALKSISGNKLRAILTMLGIIIGVMALVILVSLVNGATSTVTDTISSLGTNLLTVQISDDKGEPIYMEDLDEWAKDENIGLAAAWKTESMVAKYEAESSSVTVYGVSPSYGQIQNINILIGRYIKSADLDNNSNVCVINETAATELIGYTDCLGEQISIRGVRYTVVGVMEDDESSLTALFGRGTLAVNIPFTSYVRLSSRATANIDSFYVGAPENGSMELAQQAMNDILFERLDEDDEAYDISTQDALEDAMSSITSILTILLGGIAAISLVVGGIGIMNIMLVTVTERTREIGIRKAIGASRGTILQQFLLESVVLCMLGCVIGIFLSWGFLKVVGLVVSSLELSFEMNGTVVLVAVLFCFVIGITFGLYPANKAAKMKPIDALHYGG